MSRNRSPFTHLALAALLIALAAAPSRAAGLLSAEIEKGRRAAPAWLAESSVRARAVDVDLAPLADALEIGAELRLDLFADVSLAAVAEGFELTGPDSMAWRGSLRGEPASRVVLVLSDGMMAASIAAGERRYLVLPGRAGRHTVTELAPGAVAFDPDDAVLPSPSALAAAVSTPGASDGEEGNGEEASGASVVDLAVVYTKKAAKAAGGKRALKAMIKLALAETNTALTDSEVATQLRLAKVRKVNYDETSSIPLDLDRLQRPTDGHLDKAHRIRSGSRADLVMLVVDAMDPNRCGRAFLSPRASYPADWAFGIVRFDCLNAEYSFGHEIGHIMGLDHAREAGEAGQAYLPYGYGYEEPSGRFRTMMAIRQAGAGPRVLHFSNPEVKERGRPTGVAAGRPGEADAARAINAARQLLASYR